MIETELQPTVRRLHPHPHPNPTQVPAADQAPGQVPGQVPAAVPAPAQLPSPGAVRLGRVHGVGGGRLRHRDPTPTRTGDNLLAGRYAQRLLEVLSGHRVCEQLTALATEAVHDDVRTLVQRRCLLGPNGSQPVLWKVFDDSPAPGVLEVTASVRIGERLEMLAFRLEWRRAPRHPNGTWRFTALETRW
ncbi:Rv3235 family protein [Streptacidiphilus sp. P02-A3a]|uniref:Rv3235 family protein n=1 Tax=Streptacidiphilus sp. P02-A3a TaxID=2704468 RepID=UPI0015FB74C3|nr:Rv3235 family protein [Streptacidiphilus sp. P02-A3a]QMU67878.1 hypothetical protein GXP74_06185 [Streptacidiphilus sp. P02-A3a]